MVMVENEMKALRISEAIGAAASRMRVIFMRVRPYSAAMRMLSGIVERRWRTRSIWPRKS
jgi:hypothetical protein